MKFFVCFGDEFVNFFFVCVLNVFNIFEGNIDILVVFWYLVSIWVVDFFDFVESFIGGGSFVFEGGGELFIFFVGFFDGCVYCFYYFVWWGYGVNFIEEGSVGDIVSNVGSEVICFVGGGIGCGLCGGRSCGLEMMRGGFGGVSYVSCVGYDVGGKFGWYGDVFCLFVILGDVLCIGV